MLISMSILARHLAYLHPVVYISSDKRAIKGMRLFPSDKREYSFEYAYLCSADENTFLVVNGSNHLEFSNCRQEELINGVLSTFDFYMSWEDKLSRAAADGVPLQKMLDIASEVITDRMHITDTEGRILAITADESDDEDWRYFLEHGMVSENIIKRNILTESGQSLRDLRRDPQLFFVEADFGKIPVIFMYLCVDDENVAVFSIGLSDINSAAFCIHIAETAAKYFVLAEEFSAPKAKIKTRYSTIYDLLEGKAIEEDVLARFVAKEMPRSPLQLLVFNHISRTDYLFRKAMCRGLNTLKTKNLAVEYDNKVVAVVESKKVDAVLDEFGGTFNLQFMRIGVSLPFACLRTLPHGYKQAMFALANAPAGKGIYNCEDFAFNYLVNRLKEHEMALSLLHPAVKMLEQYDAEKGTDLKNTLRKYLHNERNNIKTSHELHLHRNGLKYRLTRINEITGINLDDEAERRYLNLSYWLMGLE